MKPRSTPKVESAPTASSKPPLGPRARRTPKDRAEEVQLAVGRRIGELRRARGLTQQGLADRVRCTAIYVAHVEGGDENLTIASLVRFAEMGLGVEVAELFRPPATTEVKRGRPRRVQREGSTS